MGVNCFINFWTGSAEDQEHSNITVNKNIYSMIRQFRQGGGGGAKQSKKVHWRAADEDFVILKPEKICQDLCKSR